jgi:hypothetical protein
MGHYRIPLLRNETVCVPHGKVQTEKPVQLYENSLFPASGIHVRGFQLGYRNGEKSWIFRWILTRASGFINL